MKSRRRWVTLTVLSIVTAAALLLAPVGADRLARADDVPQTQPNGNAQAGIAQANQLSKLFRQVAKKVGPAVVEVQVVQKVEIKRDGRDLGSMEDFFRTLPPEFRDRFETPEPLPEGPEEELLPRTPRQPKQPNYWYRRGMGSGVIVDAANGYVLTNHHVVKDADRVRITLHDGRQLKTEWIRSDLKTDLAVLKVPAENLVAASLGDSDKMEVGDWVLAIGSPEGLDQTVTAGIISAKGRSTWIGTRLDRYEDYLQTDAAINHGNSGGPLVNMRGEVVGINTAIVSRSGAYAGIGLSSPSNLVRHAMTQLIETGKVSRGYLGIYFEQTLEGAKVKAVHHGSPSGRAGLKVSDLITAIDGKKLKRPSELRLRISQMAPGSEHALTVVRDGKEMQLNVTLGEKPDDTSEPSDRRGSSREGSAEEPSVAERLGLRVSDMTPTLAKKHGYEEDEVGVVIVSVTNPGVRQMGVARGSRIVKVGEKAIETVKDFETAMDEVDPSVGVVLTIQGPDGDGMDVLITEPKRDEDEE